MNLPNPIDNVSILEMLYISGDDLQCGNNVKKCFPQFPKSNAVYHLAAIVGLFFNEGVDIIISNFKTKPIPFSKIAGTIR